MERLDRETVWKDFRRAVNMPPARLEKWLATEESRETGWSAGGSGESVGHHSGRRIVRIKRTPKADLKPADYKHMQTVVGFVRRHLAQKGPAHDRAHSRWRYSLMNWGHDPLKRA